MKTAILILISILIVVSTQKHLEKTVLLEIKKPNTPVNMDKSSLSLINRCNESMQSGNKLIKNHKLIKNIDEKPEVLLEEQMNHLMTSIRLETDFGFIYFGEIHIGSQHLPFKVLFDTGSTILWLTDRNCNTCEQSGIYQHFDCAQSNTCQSFQQKVHIQYGIGAVDGLLETDNISLGNLVAEKQSFIDIYEMKDLPNIPASGLFGLNIAADHGIKPLFDTLREQHKIEKSLFSMFLSVHHESYLMIGGTDKKFMQEQEFRYCPNIAVNFWAVSINEIQFEGGLVKNSIRFENRDGNNQPLDVRGAVIDSGSSVLVIPEPIVNEIFNSFQTEAGITCTFSDNQSLAQCSHKEQLSQNQFPDIYLKLCNLQFKIPARHYVDCYDEFCVVKIMKCPANMQVVILGDTFMQEYYTVFDQDDMRIGFALSINSQETVIENTNQNSAKNIGLGANLLDALSVIIIVVNTLLFF